MAVLCKGCRSYMGREAKSCGRVHGSACWQYCAIVHKSLLSDIDNAAEYALGPPVYGLKDREHIWPQDTVSVPGVSYR